MAKKTSNKNTTTTTHSVTPNQLNAGTFIEGNITLEGHLRLDGKMKGDINCTGKLVIGKHGEVLGNIRCHNADIMGKVEGDLEVKENTAVSAHASITGNIYTQTINIEPGAMFNGKCIMGQDGK